MAIVRCGSTEEGLPKLLRGVCLGGRPDCKANAILFTKSARLYTKLRESSFTLPNRYP